jgi:hypothetical protein
VTTPADELRTAADKLRRLATAMAEQHPGPWTVHNPNGYPQAVFSPATDVILCETLDDLEQPKPSAPYIAAMHPGVGTALADWLDVTAASLDANTHPGWQETVAPHPLAVARQINAAGSPAAG